MCESANGVHATRQLKLTGGKIVQCLVCNTVGVEFGTIYMAFAEAEFIRFAKWFDRLDAEPPEPGKERRYIQLQGGGAMLALTPHEVRTLAELLRTGVRWLPGSVGRPMPVQEASAGPWVH